MKHILILNTCIVTDTQVLPNSYIEIKNGTITALGPNEQLGFLPPEAEIIEGQGTYAVPGLIDLHIHGFGGVGPELQTEDTLLSMSEQLAKVGISGFCPTLYCAQPQDMLRTITQTVGAFGKETGARLLGYHLEGPFISPLHPGVMKPQDIAPIHLAALQQLHEAARGHLAIMTIAPELPGIEQVVSFCQKHHILLQAGHTHATYEELLQGVKLGITHTTHAFNAMRSFNHREPGAAGALLIHPEISCEIIADGVHVHPDVVAFLRKVKPLENIVLVTDALRPTAQAHGPFLANGEEVQLENGIWKRVSDDVIAGSALTLLQGIKNLVSFGYTLPEAVRCATANPARLLGLPSQGKLAIGMKGDITLFDKDFHPVRTLIEY